jgi:hypothetical protein
MYLSAQATVRAAERLIFRPLFGPGSVLVGSDDGGIDN